MKEPSLWHKEEESDGAGHPTSFCDVHMNIHRHWYPCTCTHTHSHTQLLQKQMYSWSFTGRDLTPRSRQEHFSCLDNWSRGWHSEGRRNDVTHSAKSTKCHTMTVLAKMSKACKTIVGMFGCVPQSHVLLAQCPVVSNGRWCETCKRWGLGRPFYHWSVSTED